MKNTLIASIAVAGTLMAVPALADGNAEAGATIFKKCHACHDIGPGAKNKVGPDLNGVVGKEIGSNPDYKYSKALLKKKSEGTVWNDDTLDQWLTKPRDFIKGTKMGFAGLKDKQDRENVIAYLKTFSN